MIDGIIYDPTSLNTSAIPCHTNQDLSLKMSFICVCLQSIMLADYKLNWHFAHLRHVNMPGYAH